VPLWVLLLSEGFSPVSGSGLLLSGGALLALSGHGIGAYGPGLFALNWAASVAIVIAFSYAWGSVAFWAPRAAEEINSSTMDLIDQLRAFPLDGLAPGLLGVAVAFPARARRGGVAGLYDAGRGRDDLDRRRPDLSRRHEALPCNRIDPIPLPRTSPLSCWASTRRTDSGNASVVCATSWGSWSGRSFATSRRCAAST
jgi:hypothetical protein